jgi:hypothetical protein
LVILFSCPSSFGHGIVLSFFFWAFYCLVFLLLGILFSCPSSFGHKKIERQKEEGQDNEKTKKRRTRQ